MRKLITKVFIIFFLASAIILGCKKEEATLQEKKLLKPINKSNIEELEEEPSEITTLKSYMAERINADVSEISYNATTEQFIFRGVDQFSKADLEESYSTSQIVAFLDKFTVTSGAVVNATTPTTTINFTVTYLRHSLGEGGWAPFEMNVKLGVAQNPSASVTEYLSSAYNVTSSNFASNNATVDVSYSVTVDDTKLPNGHYLVLDYNVPNPGNTSYQRYPSYTFVIQNGTSTPPSNNWWQIPSPYANSSRLNRFYSSHWGVHMMADSDEGNYMTRDWISSAGMVAWAYEGLLGHVKDTQEVNTVPLYRFFRSQNHDHYFSTNNYAFSGYLYEVIQGYVYTAPGPGLVPIYSYFKQVGNADHLYTQNYGELGAGSSTWRYDGIAFYVLQ